MQRRTGKLACRLLAIGVVGAVMAGCGASHPRRTTQPTPNQYAQQVERLCVKLEQPALTQGIALGHEVGPNAVPKVWWIRASDPVAAQVLNHIADQVLRIAPPPNLAAKVRQLMAYDRQFAHLLLQQVRRLDKLPAQTTVTPQLAAALRKPLNPIVDRASLLAADTPISEQCLPSV